MIEVLNISCKSITYITFLVMLTFLLTNQQTPQIVITPQIDKGDQFPTFQKYLELYGKKYPEAEIPRRRQNYAKSVARLKQKKNDPGITYTVGVNKFSDWSEQQIQNHKKILTDEASRKEYVTQPRRVNQNTGAIPSTLDWRDAGVITSIKDQGDCGACWTFATTAYGESRLIINKTHNRDIDLSEQYLLSCTSECSCDGGYLQYVFEKAAGGIPLQSQYPYSPYMPTSPFICWSGNKVQIGYIPQKMYDLSDNELKQLLQKGPVAISISATNWEDYAGGVFTCRNFDKVNHAVLLIGYTPSYWIIKNQWGLKWGESGFIRVSANRNNNCKIGTSAFVMFQTFRSFTLFVVAMAYLLLSF